jgi:hypothetical protein
MAGASAAFVFAADAGKFQRISNQTNSDVQDLKWREKTAFSGQCFVSVYAELTVGRLKWPSVRNPRENL